MRIRAATGSLVFAAALAGCASANTGAGTGQLDPTTSRPPPSEQSQLYSAALHYLVLVDHPYATAPTRMGSVHFVDGPASRSAQLVIAPDGPPFDTGLKSEITAQSADLPPLEFVSGSELHADPTPQGFAGVAGDGVIISMSPGLRQDDGTIHVGAGLWCGIDCGLGLTYVLEQIDGQWTVTGTTGPVFIS
ncbi:hypothetical protein [Rhodococcus sp. CH91]|uniref:hypothetical protein n=1 Tax=Rhodococcus sp. CH91 TaxID=2910256 RepID=UPI001F4A1746|nr:hypothetical protein [Rhodococcus sp. CH91]